jgi:GNAT superfamily N-acetyltransferase
MSPTGWSVMAVLKLCSVGMAARLTPFGSGSLAVRPYDPAADHVHVSALAGDLPTAGPPPIVRPQGLLGELRGRPGRDVSAWLAWQAATAPDSERAVGLITLVAARGPTGERRWSVGWLVVRPAARRGGVGRQLVAVALSAAAAAGAAVVWAETDTAWPGSLAFWRAVGFEPVRRAT